MTLFLDTPPGPDPLPCPRLKGVSPPPRRRVSPTTSSGSLRAPPIIARRVAMCASPTRPDSSRLATLPAERLGLPTLAMPWPETSAGPSPLTPTPRSPALSSPVSSHATLSPGPRLRTPSPSPPGPILHAHTAPSRTGFPLRAPGLGHVPPRPLGPVHPRGAAAPHCLTTASGTTSTVHSGQADPFPFA